MLIKLDKYTCADFLSRWIANVNIDIIQAGCAGAKISVTPRLIDDERICSEEYGGIRCWVFWEFEEKLNWGQIAQAKGKYYLVSKQIQSRCGCGTSFSFEKKVIPTDLAKIHRLKNALQLSAEAQKIALKLQNLQK